MLTVFTDRSSLPSTLFGGNVSCRHEYGTPQQKKLTLLALDTLPLQVMLRCRRHIAYMLLSVPSTYAFYHYIHFPLFFYTGRKGNRSL